MRLPADRDYVILGAGGHAKVLAETVRAARGRIRGMTSPSVVDAGRSVLGHPVLGDDRVVDAMRPEEVYLVNGLGSTGDTGRRKLLWDTFRRRGFVFPAIVHPRASVAASARLADGCQILAGAVIQADVAVSQNVVVYTTASIDHECRLGVHSFVAPGAIVCGDVVVGERAHVGPGATIVVAGTGKGSPTDVRPDDIVYKELHIVGALGVEQRFLTRFPRLLLGLFEDSCSSGGDQFDHLSELW